MTNAERFRGMSLSQLQDEHAKVANVGGSTDEQIKLAIELKLAEQQDKAADALLKATGQLGITTERLVYATWGLVGATGALVLAEIVLKLTGK